jgi:hypothetical protein
MLMGGSKIEGLRTGAWRLVPVEATPAQTNAAWNEGKRLRMTGCTEDFRSVVEAANAASPDASSALLAEIEGLRGALAELEGLVGRIEPHVDAIVCYASSMGEHEPNRIAHEVRAVAGRTQDRLVGEAIAAQIIARIDAAHPAPHEETGWLVELKGQTPSWSTIFAGDYDDHWTEDSTKAIRFARKVDAEAWIAWHGWTEVFASEHIWSDGRARATKDQPDV